MNVLVVDDAHYFQKIMMKTLKEFKEVELIECASSGMECIEKIQHEHYDLVFLDVFMPQMSGVETMKQISQIKDNKSVVILMSAQTTRNADITLKGLEAGAIDFILKPKEDSFEKSFAHLKNALIPIINLINVRKRLSHIVLEKHSSKKLSDKIDKKNEVKSLGFSCVAIGSSTGGPEALIKIIPKLPKKFKCPIFIVQHMPSIFTKLFAESLDGKSQLNVVEAKDNMEVKPGTVYIAPGKKHMVVKESHYTRKIFLNDSAPVNSCRPSIDVLFESVSNAYPHQGVLSVVLTGMGQDGMEGVKKLKRNHCYTITQSAKTCVVYGMPKAIDDHGLSDVSVDIDDIYLNLIALVEGDKK